jgi:hypothetical protein
MKWSQAVWWCFFSFIIAVTHMAVSAQDLKANAIAWNPVGSLLAVGTETGAVLFNKDLNKIQALPGYEGRVGSVTWSPDSQFLAAVGLPKNYFDFRGFPTDLTLLVWEYDPLTQIYKLMKTIDYDKRAYVLSIEGIVWHPTASKLAVIERRWLGGQDQVLQDFIVLWDTDRWESILELPNIYQDLHRILWSPNGLYLAGHGEDVCSRLVEGCPDDFIGGPGLFIADGSTGQGRSFNTGFAGQSDFDWFGDAHLAVTFRTGVFFKDVLPDGTLGNGQGGFVDETYPQSAVFYSQAELTADGAHILVYYATDDTLSLVNTETSTIQPLLEKAQIAEMRMSIDQDTLAIIHYEGPLSITHLSDLLPNSFPERSLSIRTTRSQP